MFRLRAKTQRRRQRPTDRPQLERLETRNLLSRCDPMAPIDGWTPEVLFQGPGDSTSFDQRFEAGRGYYLHSQHTHNSTGSEYSLVDVRHMLPCLGTYDPVAQGPLDSIDLSLDYLANFGPHALNLTVQPVLRQGNEYFTSGWHYLQLGSWQSESFVNLRGINFWSGHPADFTTGAPMSFGLEIRSTGGRLCLLGCTFSYPSVLSLDMINFNVVTHPLPQVTTSLRLTASTLTPNAGVPFALTVTALDATGLRAFNYGGTVGCTSTDPIGTMSADYTFTPADAGQHALTTILRRSPRRTITCRDRASPNIAGSIDLDVQPGPATQLNVSIPNPVVAGVARDIAVTAWDQFGNQTPDYRGTIGCASNIDQWNLGPYAFTATDAGQHTFVNGLTLRTAVRQTITCTDRTYPSIFGFTFVDVQPGTVSALEVNMPNIMDAGVARDITVTARDQFGNKASGYRGTVCFTSRDDRQATLPGCYTFTAADAGMHTFANGLILRTSGPRTVTTTDAVNHLTPPDNVVLVNPGAAASFVLDVADTLIAGAAGDITVTAVDRFNNAATGYRGTIHFMSSDGQATLPRDYSFSALDIGRRYFRNGLILRTPGTQTVTVTDTASGINGSAQISVTPGPGMNAFPVQTANSQPNQLTIGPDGNLWFSEYQANKIGRMTQAGVILNELPLPTPGSNALAITRGPDGNVWFVEEQGNRIGRVNLSANPLTVTEFLIPTSDSRPRSIVVGPDGKLWFTEARGNKIGRISTTGVVEAEFPIPAPNSSPGFITLGPDGNLWFTETAANAIAKIMLSGEISEYPIPTPNSAPQGITAGPDGNLWFTEAQGNAIGVITTDGNIVSETAVPTPNSTPVGIAAGPDGNVWFTEGDGNAIGRITCHMVTEFPIQTNGSMPFGIIAGTDSSLWFAERTGNAIVQVTLDQLGPPPSSPSRGLPNGFASFNDTTGEVSVTNAGSTQGRAPRIDSPPGSARTLQIDIPAIVSAGVPTDITVTAKDEFGRRASGYRGTVCFTSSDRLAAFPNCYTFAPVDAGSHTWPRGLLMRTAGPQTVTVTDTIDDSITGTAVLLVNPGPVRRFVLDVTPVLTAGQPADLTVVAVDAYGNVAAGYRGTVCFTSTDPSMTLPGCYTFTAADAGRHTFAGLILRTAGQHTICVTDTVDPTITGCVTILVTPAPAVSFSVVAPTNVTSGRPFDIRVTALDPYGNIDVNYSGTATFSTSDRDPGVVLPATYTFGNGDAGQHTFTDSGAGETTLISLGDQTVTVADPFRGISGTVTVTVQSGASAPFGFGSNAAMLEVKASAPSASTSGRGLPDELLRTLFPGEASLLDLRHIDHFFADSSENSRRIALAPHASRSLAAWEEEIFHI